jgi:hypothetical protein
VNVEDLRSCRKSGTPEASDADRHVAEFDRLVARQLQNAHVVGSLVRQATRLQECVRDQRAALRGLRDALARLRDELQSTRRAMRLFPLPGSPRR